ncbi:uromodulin-like 1 isoform X1 [Dunckerocampus dactyliophorus]|uniref:uromodulin-like 1 isoform X1 n=1 Tax=Dunckerocampus dactyliophorus TaxID=161453 RepID=UPI0024052463|nr:uromodulin-like 1 isoform X1 [Dunckerocampus dactyliophorus]
MPWMLVAAMLWALPALCTGQTGEILSPSGYHLCMYNQTRTVSSLVVRKVPYTVTKPCGGWLSWMTCPVTLYRIVHQTEYSMVTVPVTRCCDGYVQVGSYCALSLNRSEEFTIKPGSCPAANGSYSSGDDCDWDIDCPGWEKCCEKSGRFLCSGAASSANYVENGGCRFNATVTVKTDYQKLKSKDGALVNHTRLVQAMVTGALQSDLPVYYLSSWPVHPYRTATSMLIDCIDLSLHNVTAKLHVLLKHIQEVSDVTVEDLNECAHPALHQCSPRAQCNNTAGSYQCACRTGYIDVDPSNPGTHCAAPNDITVSSTTEAPACCPFSANSTLLQTTVNSTVRSFIAPRNTHTVPSTTFAPTTSTKEPPLPTTSISLPGIINLQSANITGTSFCVYWSSLTPTQQTYLVVLSEGSDIIDTWTTEQTMMEIKELQPGVYYNVTVKIHSNESQGDVLYIALKTEAQTLDATARITNIAFTPDLQNASSRAYKNLTASLKEEIYRSLSPELKAMVNSSEVRIEIRSFSPGSVVVNFTMIFSPSPSQDITTTSTALLYALMNSSLYTVDENNTSINDFDECVPGINDCSQWATCTNTWGSYSCTCLDGFMDTNPQRPGRACQASLETTSLPLTSTLVLVSTSSQITTSTDPAPAIDTTVESTTAINAPAIAVNILPATSPAISATNNAPTNTTNTPTITTTIAPATTTCAPAMNALTITTTESTTAMAPASASPTTTSIASVTTTPALTTYVATTLSNASAMIASTSATPTSNSIALTATASEPTTTSAPTRSTTASTPTTIESTTTSLPTTTTTAPATTSHSMPTTTTAIAEHPATNAIMSSVLDDISVDCKVTGITVTVARDFLVNNNIRESTLYLGQQECRNTGGNVSHAQLTVEWNDMMCVTNFVQNDTYYMASVTLFNTMEPYNTPNGTLEAPTLHLEVPIICTYMRSMLMSPDFGSMGYNLIKDVITGSGLFQVTVQLLNGTVPLPYNYTLSPEEAVVVQVSMNTSADQIKVVISSCWATPTPNPADNERYFFLDNRCALNTYTDVLMNGNSSTSRVSVRIFSFVSVNLIYLHCQVQICMQIGSDTCVPDCVQRTAWSSNTIGRAFGSSGPLLKSEEVPLEDINDQIHLIGLSCLGVALVLFLILGFACLFYYQRNRIGHYNFTVKPQNFTSIDFQA